MTYAFITIASILAIAYHSLSIELKIGDLSYSTNILEFSAIIVSSLFLVSIVRGLFSKVLYAFDWYKRYREANLPNRAIAIIVQHMIGSERVNYIQDKDIPSDKLIYISLINFIAGGDLNRGQLSQQIHGTYIASLDAAIIALKDCDYINAISPLEDLLKRYGPTTWIYRNLRECYLKTHNFQKLDVLNSKVPDSYIRRFSSTGRNEGKVMLLKSEYDTTNNLKKKLSVLANIHNAAPEDEMHLIKYVELLQNFGQFDLALTTIKNAWHKAKSLNLSRVLLSILQHKPAIDAYNFVKSIQDQSSVATKFLAAKAAMRAEMFEDAKRIATEIISSNPLLGQVLQLEIADATGHVHMLGEIIASFAQMSPELFEQKHD